MASGGGSGGAVEDAEVGVGEVFEVAHGGAVSGEAESTPCGRGTGERRGGLFAVRVRPPEVARRRTAVVGRRGRRR